MVGLNRPQGQFPCEKGSSCVASTRDTSLTNTRRKRTKPPKRIFRKTMRFIIALIALAVHAAAQTSFLSRPSQVWSANISPVGEGNECAMAPTSSNPLLICTGTDGYAIALQPNSATRSTPVWTYQPDPISVMSSTSGVTFSSTGSFFVYATTDTNSTSSIWYVSTLLR